MIILLIIFFALRQARTIFRNLALWQIKEYRLDRIILHYKNTDIGRKELRSPFAICKWTLLTIGFFTSQLFVLVIYLALLLPEIGSSLVELKNGTLKRPKVITPRIVLTSILAIAILLSVTYFARSLLSLPPLVVMILVDRLTFASVGLGMAVTAVPSVMLRLIAVKKALVKREQLSKLIVIGITGSVGKTSTKEFTCQLLKNKFLTAATQEHDNSDIGIARSILNNVTPETEIFVAEMGAYKRGEIANLCKIAKPKIGILTYIGTQHLELFGGKDNITQAKYELIESLPQDGTAILNTDNEVIESLVSKTRAQVKTITIGTKGNPDIKAENITLHENGISFKMTHRGKTVQINTQIYGANFVPNLLAAAASGIVLGMSLKDIKTALEKLKNPNDALRRIVGPSKSLFFDDTYNASPESVAADVELLNNYPGIKTKFLVLQPMIELGDTAKEEHLRVGKYLKEGKLNGIFLTNINFKDDIQNGAQDKANKIYFGKDSQELADKIRSLLDPQVGIVFKGKESNSILLKLQTQ